VGRITVQPGWKWSQDVKPVAGTDLCMAPHQQYQLSGHMHILMSDGTELDTGPGEITSLPPGHDAWVVGDEQVVAIDWQGFRLGRAPGVGRQSNTHKASRVGARVSARPRAHQTADPGRDRVISTSTDGRTTMAGFVQIIEFQTSRYDEAEALGRAVQSRLDDGRPSSPRRTTITADRDRPGYYLNIVEFDSREAAMDNSARAEVGEFAAQLAQLCDSPLRFYNLDVREVWQPSASA